jgi:hypothetical protein
MQLSQIAVDFCKIVMTIYQGRQVGQELPTH